MWTFLRSTSFLRRLNGWLTLFWVAMIPLAVWQGWLKSVAFVSALSLWALVSGHWSAWQAARGEEAAARSAAETVEAMVEDERVPTN